MSPFPKTVIADKITTTRPFPGPVMVTLEPPIKETTIPPTIAAIIPEIGGAPEAKASPKPKGRAIRETTKPEKRFLGISPMNVFRVFFLFIILQLKHLLVIQIIYIQYHVEKFYPEYRHLLERSLLINRLF